MSLTYWDLECEDKHIISGEQRRHLTIPGGHRPGHGSRGSGQGSLGEWMVWVLKNESAETLRQRVGGELNLEFHNVTEILTYCVLYLFNYIFLKKYYNRNRLPPGLKIRTSFGPSYTNSGSEPAGSIPGPGPEPGTRIFCSALILGLVRKSETFH